MDPTVPFLDIAWNATGVSFTGKANPLGDKASVLYWNYSLFNSSTNSWEGWAGWIGESPLRPFTKEFGTKANYSKIAFALYATNSCGSSSQAREVSTNTGVPLAALIQDDFIVGSTLDLSVSMKISVSQVVRSKNGLITTLYSSTPEICKVENDQLVFSSPGSCKIVAKALSKFNIYRPADLDLVFPVLKKLNVISMKVATPIYVGMENVPLITSTFPTTYEYVSLTPEVCKILSGVVTGVIAGNCRLQVITPESETIKSSSSEFTFTVWPGQQELQLGNNPSSVNISSRTILLDVTLTSALPVNSQSLTPSICRASGLTLSLVGAGNCLVRLSSPETPNYLRVPTRDISIQITQSKITIVCAKGKLIKSVTGVMPKCPAGYKKK